MSELDPPPDSPNAPEEGSAATPASPPGETLSAAEVTPEQPHGPRREYPEDLRTPWGWGQLLLFTVVAFVCLFLVTTTMSAILIFGYHMSIAEVRTYATTSARFNSLGMAIVYVLLIGYLYLTIHSRNYPAFWRTIGWRHLSVPRIPRAALYPLLAVCGMALAVLVQLGALAFPTKHNLPMEALFHSRTGILWLMAVGILLAPAVEETVFRGYLYPVMARSFGIEWGVVVTGTLFGLMHAHQLWGGWGQIGLLIFVGIVLTYVRARSGSVVASWLIHVGYNTFLFAGFFISTGGLRHLPPVN